MEISMRWLCLASYNVHFSDESEGVQTTHTCLSDMNLSFPKPDSHDELQFGNNML
jgi:hypothetical protein